MSITRAVVQVDELIKELGQPRAAFAYGVAMRELSHNWFLHTLLRLPIGPALMQELAKAVASSAPGGHKVWDSMASGTPKIVAWIMNRSGEAGRPDETVMCTAADGGACRVVVEMKTEAAAYEAQLSKYVDAKRGRTEDDAAGLLLRIPGRDHVDMRHHASMAGWQYLACIESAIKSCDLDQDSRWLVEDYCRTLRFLDRLDVALMEQGNELWSRLDATPKDSPANLWFEDHWRWMEQRVVREVQSRTGGIVKWSSVAKDIKSDANGYFIDFWPMPPEPLSLGTPGVGASYFAKWRQGSGLEIHVIVQNYDKPALQSPASLDLMDRLWSAGLEILPSLWAHAGKAGSKRPGASRMVGRLEAHTYDVQEIVDMLQKELPPIYDVLASVVAKLRAG